MVRLLCQDDARFAVEPMEVERGGLSFTVETLRAIQARDRGAALFLLMGGDVVDTLPSWREPAAVLELAEVVVLTRAGDGPRGAGPGRQIETRRVDISSSEVRARIAAGLPITGFVTDAVAAYIRTRRLYEPTSRRAHERTRHE
jgi:nicotinate-nucleotide adenylyltransferase